ENKDTLITQIDTLNLENETKYDRIKRMRIKQSSSQSLTELIDDNFAYFLLYDLVSADDFNKIYDDENKKMRNNQSSSNTTAVSDKERYNNKEIILMTPYLQASKKGIYDVEQTIKFNEIYESEVRKQTKKKNLLN